MGASLAVFSYSATELARLELLLSKERLGPYALGSLQDTVKNYERNIIVAEAFYAILQGVEIALRNTIHNAMTTGTGRQDWYDYIPWASPEADALDRAKDTLTKRHKPLAAGSIIAELTFGFWIQPVARKYEKVLWVPYIYKPFPFITTNRNGLHDRLNHIRKMQNRIAHYERILHFNLQVEYRQIIETAEWICPITAAWIDSTNRVKKLLWP
jgi:hypothetical protein